MSTQKPAWNKGLHTQKIQTLLNSGIIWYDEVLQGWNRKCPKCKKIITYSSRRAFEICIRAHGESRFCNSCGRRLTKQNLIGKTFGMLTVIDEAPYRASDPGPYWKCKCKCGNTTEVKSRSLTGGITKTCGSVSHRWRGYKEISGRYYSHLKSGAIKRNIVFSITLEEMWDIFVSQNRRCSYSGEILTFGKNATASLDRVDSSGGYTKKNVHWIHKDINKMKNNISPPRFLELCRSIASYTTNE